MSKLKSIIPWEIVCFLSACLGAVASRDSQSFYRQLILPEWAPPAWAFGVVWPILYFLMGISAGLVWNMRMRERVFWPILFFCIQLMLNAVWTWIFFGMGNATWALIEILVLFVMIVLTTVLFARHHAVAAILMLPYVLWTGFACALTYSIWQMNPSLL